MTLQQLASHFYENPTAHFMFADHSRDGFVATLQFAMNELHYLDTKVAWWKIDSYGLAIILETSN